jgi:hypothetical protein
VRRWLGLLVVAGCYHPAAQPGLPCSEDGSCPTTQVCDQQQSPPTCVDTRIDSGTTDADLDATVDAPTVGCTTSASCPATEPVCDPGTRSCRGCVADAECESDVCHELAGSCVAESEALYVGPVPGGGGSCTRTAPCSSIATALSMVTPARHTIRIADATYSEDLDLGPINGLSTIVLSGTDRDWNGAVIAAAQPCRVDLGTTAILEGLTLQNAVQHGVENRGTVTLSRVRILGSADTGLISRNVSVARVLDSRIETSASIGIVVDNGTLEVRRSVVVSNTGGGIRIGSAGFTIESSIIANNGVGAANGSGGVRIGAGSTPGVFQFNTVARNRSDAGVASGVQCDRTVTIESSILAFNTSLFPQELSFQCGPRRSLFAMQAPQGMGNIDGDPRFASMTDFHLLPGSPAIDATTTAPPGRDVDGDPRPAGVRADIGADEVP